MHSIQEVSKRIFNDSKGLSKNRFSIVPYQQELNSLDPLEFILWHAGHPQLYFVKLMHATAFVWKDLSWQQWREGMLRLRNEFQSLFNLLTFLTRFLQVDAFKTLKGNPDIDPEIVNQLKVFFAQPLNKPGEKEIAYLTKLNEMEIDLAGISRRLYQEGAPKAKLRDPDVRSL
jgi:hypothetical protein